ncbi:5-methylthioadenosine/S-adenosylhomocysteine deaminase [Mycolicibacterium murale]|uniref:5-methylthioadenosine/S-adenosylhomocysteine deaminase n=1 Tax=Mycolicibacterium murale TaxID=182220 RepID=A0A7I9WM51_9MYCO|nr:amidohydrolase family protein [Mycolicibacterium murale]MCV7180398.1 amidohydrolase family protein [Mycolicibacterium murale]GFG58733.1 5-methylthioadenosine/S-adenosylhomocysteine deaminase [Mycolicibacterium murale]
MSKTAWVGARVLTMDPAGTEYAEGAVVTDGDRIVAVGAADRVDTRGAELVDCSGSILLPGFVNAHTHASQILLRGGPNHSRGLYDWLLNVVVPGLAAYTDDDLRTAISLYCLESIRAGVTTVVANEEPVGDNPREQLQIIADTFRDSGMRARVAVLFRDQRPEAVGSERGVSEGFDLPAGDELDETFALIAELGAHYRGVTAGMVDVWPSPATTAVASTKALRRSARHAVEHGGRWALHLAEIPLEQSSRGYSPVRYLDELGLLDHRLVAAHCVHVDGDDIAALAASRAAIVTNPVSNCFLASGIAPVPAMLAAGAVVTLGTDDANVNDAVNPISDIKTLALLHRAVTADPTVLQPEELVRMATVDGALALGLQDVGHLAAGMAADFQVVKADDPHMIPSHDPYATLVFQALGHEVRDVVIAGKQVMRNRRVAAHSDATQLSRRAQQASAAVLDRAGISPRRSLA